MLGQTEDPLSVVRAVMAASTRQSFERRNFSVAALKAIAGLRQLERIILEEENAMPAYFDLSTSPLFRREYADIMAKLAEGRKQGREEGREEGLEKGLEQGRERLRKALKLSLRGAFHRIPRWASERIDTAQDERLINWIAKVPGSPSIEAVLGKR